jgi:hypothetical protein
LPKGENLRGRIHVTNEQDASIQPLQQQETF